LIDNLNAKILLGQDVSLAEHASVVSGMVRLATRLGLKRHSRPVLSVEDELVERYKAMSVED
jgi:hypothetical protein